jgi:glyoxylase-like metal-dependent hydrolase (beta-lactamase superfamily II)
MRFALALLALASALPVSAADVVRVVSSEQDFAVNSWLVPTGHGIVVIDTQFTVAEASKLVEAVTQSGRPLEAIIITHPHPDHYNGTCQLLEFARVPVYATQATIDGIRATAESKRAQGKPTYGKNYPDSTCLPDHVAPRSGSVRIDGLEFQFRDYGPGEASGESIILAPALRAAFVGDVIYNQVHPWLAEGRSAQWLAQLDAGGVAVIDAQRRYVSGFRATIKAQLGPSGLAPDATKAIVEGVHAQHSDWPLAMLIPMNTDAVAKELAATALH